MNQALLVFRGSAPRYGVRPSSQRAKTPFDGSKRSGFHFEQAESRRFPRNKTPITTKRSPSPASARPEDRTFLQGDLLSDPKRSSEDHLIFIDLLRSLKMRWRTAGFSPSFGLVHPVPPSRRPGRFHPTCQGMKETLEDLLRFCLRFSHSSW